MRARSAGEAWSWVLSVALVVGACAAGSGPAVQTASPAEGGDPGVGQLGSFTWGAGGSDSPWLPGTPLTVGAGERLTGSISGGVGVAEWSARYVKAGSAGGSGTVGLGSGTATIAITAPGPGSWSLQLAVRFAAGLGSATYYWRLTVR